MENQHRKIIGYRELDENEIALMNKVKEQGKALQALTDELRASEYADPRWLAIGITDLQKGLMALTRAVAKPDFF